jgi:hypothetical protein
MPGDNGFYGHSGAHRSPAGSHTAGHGYPGRRGARRSPAGHRLTPWAPVLPPRSHSRRRWASLFGRGELGGWPPGRRGRDIGPAELEKQLRDTAETEARAEARMGWLEVGVITPLVTDPEQAGQTWQRQRGTGPSLPGRQVPGTGRPVPDACPNGRSAAVIHGRSRETRALSHVLQSLDTRLDPVVTSGPGMPQRPGGGQWPRTSLLVIQASV